MRIFIEDKNSELRTEGSELRGGSPGVLPGDKGSPKGNSPGKRGFPRRMGNFLIITFFLFSMTLVLAEEQNNSVEKQAGVCLKESGEILNELGGAGFGVLRINNSLNQAKDIFDAQIILQQKQKKTDFSPVITHCENIKTIREKAFEARDELVALKKFYNELLIEEMDTTDLDKIILKIEDEIKSERYEKTNPLIDEAYEEIVRVQADYTAINVFYKNVTANLKESLYKNWIYFVSGFVLLIVLFFVYKKTISQWIIKRKIRKLEIRKGTLKNLIKITQDEYFNSGKISDGIYNVKVKKFAELVRDIDRQIPLLEEQIYKIKNS